MFQIRLARPGGSTRWRGRRAASGLRACRPMGHHNTTATDEAGDDDLHRLGRVERTAHCWLLSKNRPADQVWPGLTSARRGGAVRRCAEPVPRAAESLPFPRTHAPSRPFPLALSHGPQSPQAVQPELATEMVLQEKGYGEQ